MSIELAVQTLSIGGFVSASETSVPSEKTAAWERVVFAYMQYYEEVSPQSIHLQTANDVFQLLDSVDSACDLGTGFSSVLLREYAQHVRNIPILSVDDNPYWLEKNKEFVKSANLPNDTMVLLETIDTIRPPRFDLVIHDMGNNAFTRIRTLPLAIQMAKRFLVIDDANYWFYRAPAKLLLPTKRITPLSPNKYFRKYAWLVEF